PENTQYAEMLAAYRAEAEQQRRATLAQLPWTSAAEPAVPVVGGETAVAAAAARGTERLTRFDWGRGSDPRTREACAVWPALLDPETCAEIGSWFEDESRFVKTVIMDQEDFGAGVYRYFRSPIPAVVDGLRRAVYRRMAPVANAWQRLLGEP